jgi:hypothetical protein
MSKERSSWLAGCTCARLHSAATRKPVAFVLPPVQPQILHLPAASQIIVLIHLRRNTVLRLRA